MAMLQAIVTVSFAVWVCGLETDGPVWQLGLVAVTDAVLGSTLGLFASAFARTEFQVVQFMSDKQATDAGTLLNAKWANAVG